ncbi:MAG: redox-sensing transcriptional repressor Rex [Candidatus Firestonebacteria bacterium RIFOXYA2_FULL_40_8]|nr:MAG: redox-sensing transcriptional repressor Rex [Candidatus Firestonebacteria bacterium RIFOXYA2_FULL_40_8]
MSESKSCILRLCRYRRTLKDLKELGYVKIFSDNLGEATGVTATQVRKDFSLFGISGNKKGGYLIDNLIEKINYILGKDEIQKVILVGAGNLGSALTRYKGFEKEDINIVAAFDADPAKNVKVNNIQVHPIKDVFDYVRNHKVRVAVLAVPSMVAQEVSEILISAGIRGILNFAPVTLKVPERIIVNNVNLAIELENVIYYVNARERNEKQNKTNPVQS